MIRAEQALQRLEGIDGKLDTIMKALSLWEEDVEVEDATPLLLATASVNAASHDHHHIDASSTHRGMSLVMTAPPEYDKMKDR